MWHIFLASKKKHLQNVKSPEVPWRKPGNLMKWENNNSIIFQDSQASKEMDRNGISSSSGSLQKWFLLGKVRVQQPIFLGWYLCQFLRFLKRFENPFSTNNLHLESALGLMKPVNVQRDFTLIPYTSQNEGTSSPGGRKSSSETWQSPFFQ